jgi:20S proteasome alpha/beta subunit
LPSFFFLLFIFYILKIIISIFSEDIIATGFGAYIAIPLLRNAREQNPHLTEEQAKQV